MNKFFRNIAMAMADRWVVVMIMYFAGALVGLIVSCYIWKEDMTLTIFLLGVLFVLVMWLALGAERKGNK